MKSRIKEPINSEELVFYNLDVRFIRKMNNPFSDSAKYYKYPTLLKKNIFQINDNIFQSLIIFLKRIYKSDLLQEIFYSIPEFNEFKYPLLDDDILEEMIENTVFLPFNQDKLYGYTQKQFCKVYIPVNLLNYDISEEDLSNIIIEISYFINNVIQECFNNYIKALLFYNSFRYKSSNRLKDDLLNK